MDAEEQGSDKPKIWQAKPTKRIVLIALALIVLFGAFYWISVRPVFTRKNCSHRAMNNAIFTYDPSRYDISVYNQSYSACLHKNGL